MKSHKILWRITYANPLNSILDFVHQKGSSVLHTLAYTYADAYINISEIELIFYVRGVNLNNLSFIKVYGVRIPFYYTTILLERNINMVCSFIFFLSYILILHWSSFTSGFQFPLPVLAYLFSLWNTSLHDFPLWCIRLKYIMSHILTVLLSKVLNYTTFVLWVWSFKMIHFQSQWAVS